MIFGSNVRSAGCLHGLRAIRPTLAKELQGYARVMDPTIYHPARRALSVSSIAGGCESPRLLAPRVLIMPEIPELGWRPAYVLLSDIRQLTDVLQ